MHQASATFDHTQSKVAAGSVFSMLNHHAQNTDDRRCETFGRSSAGVIKAGERLRRHLNGLQIAIGDFSERSAEM